jgi:hypothetical protein
MSFGCIPIVLSDGLVLPFDRSIDWPEISFNVPEKDVGRIPTILETLPHRRIDAMQTAVNRTYAQYLSGFEPIVRTLVSELEMIVRKGAPLASRDR